MTCLIGTLSGIWGDRRVSGEARRFAPQRKVFRNALGMIAGFCGADSHCIAALRKFRDANSTLQDLSDACDGIVLTPAGRLYELWGGVVSQRKRVACHGSGFAEAEAFIAGAGKCDERTIRRALAHVARVRVDCGDGIYGLRL